MKMIGIGQEEAMRRFRQMKQTVDATVDWSKGPPIQQPSNTSGMFAHIPPADPDKVRRGRGSLPSEDERE